MIGEFLLCFQMTNWCFDCIFIIKQSVSCDQMWLFFHRQRERRNEWHERRGRWWRMQVNKVVLDLALSVRVPATLITISTVITRAARILNERAYRPIPFLRHALIHSHVSIPHVSGSEGEGFWIYWKMGCQVGQITLLWFPHPGISRHGSQHNYYPPILAVLYCKSAVSSWGGRSFSTAQSLKVHE